MRLHYEIATPNSPEAVSQRLQRLASTIDYNRGVCVEKTSLERFQLSYRDIRIRGEVVPILDGTRLLLTIAHGPIWWHIPLLALTGIGALACGMMIVMSAHPFKVDWQQIAGTLVTGGSLILAYYLLLRKLTHHQLHWQWEEARPHILFALRVSEEDIVAENPVLPPGKRKCNDWSAKTSKDL